ncbi:LytR C-terminal domain-containing protein [Mycolicibacterium rufum]|uniref:LytR C-terminal domain-containing protein n=1 Tax=Mycolicibacterium rufum TaxID=318424 RepID=A0ABY3UJW4_9MYCO|nr:LytR C-terminal domain-containing protein [Mycolicibacterium rufum]KGI66616.1 Tuberculin related peptide [Mycolicibacterium rufum]ULP37395.1 LytR C-terminal domain-containing protein [Mycolicibacterium rufum]
MNQRESSGLPLRAIVMVLLFLGVVFLLVGFQALSGGDDDSSDSDSITTSITSTPTTPSSTAAPAKAEVRVFNISTTEGAAETTANRLRDAGWNVTETGNLTLPETTVTTVFFSDAPGEQQAAEEIGRLLEAPVAPRVPEVTDQPPGVIVAVTG